MFKKQKQKNNSSKIGLAVVVSVVIVFFLIIGFGREYLSNLQVEREIQELEDERAALQDEKLSTLQLIDDLSSEYYLEKQARTKQGLARSGEKLLIVKDDDTNILIGAIGVEEDLFSLESISNPIKWYYYFFDTEKFNELKEL